MAYELDCPLVFEFFREVVFELRLTVSVAWSGHAMHSWWNLGCRLRHSIVSASQLRAGARSRHVLSSNIITLKGGRPCNRQENELYPLL